MQIYNGSLPKGDGYWDQNFALLEKYCKPSLSKYLSKIEDKKPAAEAKAKEFLSYFPEGKFSRSMIDVQMNYIFNKNDIENRLARQYILQMLAKRDTPSSSSTSTTSSSAPSTSAASEASAASAGNREADDKKYMKFRNPEDQSKASGK